MLSEGQVTYIYMIDMIDMMIHRYDSIDDNDILTVRWMYRKIDR